MRLYDLGRARGGRLSDVRSDDVQKVREGVQKTLLYQRKVRELHPRGEAGRVEEKARRGRRGGSCGGTAKSAAAKKPAAKKTVAAPKSGAKKATTAKKPAAKKAASKKA